jgi:hypothetical protein
MLATGRIGPRECKWPQPHSAGCNSECLQRKSFQCTHRLRYRPSPLLRNAAPASHGQLKPRRLLQPSSPLAASIMSVTVVLGAQWGDEGKGKLADILANESQICCRAQGGNNAGHTIVANGVTYDFHILPSGLVNPNCINVIGSGCVVHVPSFFKELEALEKHGLKTEGRIYISDRAHVVFDVHQQVDGLEEVELGQGFIGTTKKGIGPAYSTKMTRSGLRMCDLFDEDVFEQKLNRLATGFQKRFGDLLKYDVKAEIEQYKVCPSSSLGTCPPNRLTRVSSNSARSLRRTSSTRFRCSPRPRRARPRSSSRAPTP